MAITRRAAVLGGKAVRDAVIARYTGRLINTLLWALLLVILGLVSPILYVETLCRPSGTATPYSPILPVTDRRPESATLLTWARMADRPCL